MLRWVIRGVFVGAAGGVGYVVGHRKGGKELAARLLADRPFAQAVMEKLAQVHGAKLEYFDLPGGPPPEASR
jgi:hypothetical protein